MSIAQGQFANLAIGDVIDGMQTVTETRLARLTMLVEKHNGSLAELNEAIGLVRTDATLSQIRTKAPHSKTGKPRVMGDDVARKREERLSLETGWMDTPPSYEPHNAGDQEVRVPEAPYMDNQTSELIAACSGLSTKDMEEIILFVKFKANMNKTNLSVTINFDDQKSILKTRRKFVSPALDAAVARANSKGKGNDGEHQQAIVSRGRKTG
jgi:hypothetical protein